MNKTITGMITEKAIIATDFDGTLCMHAYPEIGIAFDEVIDVLKKLRSNGCGIILHTCRNGDKLKEAVDWCKNKGLEFDAVNDDVEIIKNSEFGKTKSNKIFADYYLDDRNISLEDIYLDLLGDE